MLTPGLDRRRGRTGVPEQAGPGSPSAALLVAAGGIRPGGEPTAVHEGKERPAIPRLVVTEGPRKGSEFALLPPVMTIGRALGNAICIPDLAMSRRHLRIVQRGSAWIVFDDGSGNGTCVNGKPARRRRLRHGDEIAMGDTAARFVEPFGVLVRTPEPARRSPCRRWSRGRLLISLALSVAALTILGAILVRERRASALSDARVRARAERALGQARFREGTALLKQGLWLEGRDKLRVALELTRDPEIARQLQAAEAEVPRVEALAAARSALRRRDFAAAREALAQIPATSALAEEAQIVGSALPPAPGAPQTQRLEGERLRSADPERSGPVRGILGAYWRGDLATALSRARASSDAAARRLAGSLARLASAWRSGAADRDPASSVRWLQAAVAADRALDPARKGRIAGALGKALAARHLALAEALSNEDDLPRAAAHLRAAAQADPSSAETAGRLEQVSVRAREMYLRAYAAMEESPEQARKGFRTVADSLPGSDELGLKARRWLSGLEGKVPE